MTETTTYCGTCRTTFDVGDQSLTPDADALPTNQCATCARVEARGIPGREYPMFDGDRVRDDAPTCWQPDDRVELVAWQPDDLVWLATDA